jgi:hypothetical protein
MVLIQKEGRPGRIPERTNGDKETDESDDFAKEFILVFLP